tara:strand:+ start:155 stop:343 length:189 start_codon:yes stop_codon:yes gene_type:complete
MSETRVRLDQRERQFKDLYAQGCRSSIVMANLENQIGLLRIEVMEEDLELAKENLKPFFTNY